MIRVLHILDTLRRGGKERQFIELIRGIDRSVFQVHTVILEKRADGYDEEAKALSHCFKYMPRRFRWDLGLVRDLIDYCRQNNIDIIHAWEGMTSFYGLLASCFCNAEVINGTIRDTDPRRNYRQLYTLLVLRLSKHIVANSYAGLKAYGVEKKGSVIYNGIDLSRFLVQKKPVTSKFIVGIVANLTEYKDYFTFFDAIHFLYKRIDNLEVHVFGDGRFAQSYKEYAEKIGLAKIVKFWGRVQNVEEYIPSFDVGVLSSYKDRGEAISNSVLEYMACGVAPVITNVGAAKEIIEDGVTGLLFEPGDPNDLARKILMLREKKEQGMEMGQRARLGVEKQFSYERYVKETEQYYLSLLPATQVLKDQHDD